MNFLLNLATLAIVIGIAAGLIASGTISWTAIKATTRRWFTRK